MSIIHLGKAFQLIDAHPDVADPFEPKSLDLLRKAEATLGVKFPPTYRRFVLRYGTLGLGPDEFFGLTSENFTNSCVPNVVWCTLNDRRLYSVPDYLITIYVVNDGPAWAIDTSRDSEGGEHPIVEYFPTISEPPYKIIAPDFGFLLLREVRMALAMRTEQRGV